ncbi:lipase/esterase [Alcanivorax hongdengensis A-11-3]|uniref:Lipase/esterase n=1 Tax=Alcanivorax hongdengensis A-11-3 TaxID=1177179 RepID=L0W8Y9_9GAMM|nr:alpha/beta hydrolase [Alcanivorax hongdengensis]EKF73429.1 lipase/esterase [Alcanivorax hongdengensis A-11-3]
MIFARIERMAVRTLMALPDRLLHGMAAAVESHSRPQLDGRMRLLMALSGARPALNTLSVAGARSAYGEMIDLLDVPRQKVRKVSDHRVPVADGNILVRTYRPAGAGTPAPAIMFFHGGGFTVGGVREYDRLCRFIANRTGAVVASVDYRLAPEHPSPLPADDSLAAWRWLCDNAESLGLDSKRLAVMGDSAGGNLSAVVCQQAAARGLAIPALQVLIYPTTDGALDHESVQTLGEGFGLDRALLTWFRSHFLPDLALIEDYRVSPLRNPELADLPPAILVTATDPLRDEGLEYGEKLRAAGIPVMALDYPQLVHGFVTMGGAIPAARRAVLEICEKTAALL